MRRELFLKRRQLGEAKSEAQLYGNNSRVRALKEEINDLMDKETRMWLQWSKPLWASHGDINSKVFPQQGYPTLQEEFYNKYQKLGWTVVF